MIDEAIDALVDAIWEEEGLRVDTIIYTTENGIETVVEL